MKRYVITEEQIDYISKNSVCDPQLYADIRSQPLEDILDDFALFDDSRYVFHAIQDYKRELRKRGTI